MTKELFEEIAMDVLKVCIYLFNIMAIIFVIIRTSGWSSYEWYAIVISGIIAVLYNLCSIKSVVLVEVHHIKEMKKRERITKLKEH